jgi:hypothetical protein
MGILTIDCLKCEGSELDSQWTLFPELLSCIQRHGAESTTLCCRAARCSHTRIAVTTRYVHPGTGTETRDDGEFRKISRRGNDQPRGSAVKSCPNEIQ